MLAKHRRQAQSIGLITGCFDLLHAGHIGLFHYAKKHVDILVVGLENDSTIALSKGQGRPVHNLRQRSEILSELTSVDYIFTIPIVVKFGSGADIQKQYVDLVASIQPDYLITSPAADRYWQHKEAGLRPLGIRLLKFNARLPVSTTSLIGQLRKEI